MRKELPSDHASECSTMASRIISIIGGASTALLLACSQLAENTPNATATLGISTLTPSPVFPVFPTRTPRPVLPARTPRPGIDFNPTTEACMRDVVKENEALHGTPTPIFLPLDLRSFEIRQLAEEGIDRIYGLAAACDAVR